jgi:hypothetical protein
MATVCGVQAQPKRAKRLLPRERPEDLTFTPADRAKLNSIEFGATVSTGGFPDIEQDNILVSTNEDVFNFTGHVVVTDVGFQTNIEIPEDIDGGIF